jgi:uncharacterized protein (TIGR02147 family)
VKAPDIFEFDDYKRFLAGMIEANQFQTGYKSRLASAMGSPPSFLSQVLHSHVELSLDHGIRLARFWSLSSLEQAYFQDLISLSRAGSQELKDYLKSRLNQARAQAQDLSQRFERPKISSSDEQWTYYTTWYFAAIHLLLTVPGFKTIEKIAQKLRLPEEQVEETLKTLQQMGLVEATGKSWKVTQKSIHLPKTSAASPVNHWIWRQKGIESIHRATPDDLHYTALHTLSHQSIAKLKGILLRAIDDIRKEVEPSPEEDLVCINLDLFRVEG